MDEQVIDDLFNRAVSKGYKKTRNEFVQLLHSDDEVFNDMYSYVKESGYQKSTDDFSVLVGKKKAGAKPTSAVAPTVLPLGGGSLESAPTEKLMVGPMGMTGIERTTKSKPKDGQGFLLNVVSSLDKGIYNLPGEAIKGVGTLLEGVTGKGFVSDALNKFGSSYLKAIEELTPQDESFKGSLSDQFGQAFGQVAGMVLTSGASQAAKATTALSAAKAALASQAAPKAVTIGGAVKKLASELSDPAAVSMGLAMGQGEFERAKQAGATDEQAFEAFYKNAAVGSVLEKIPVMQFLKRFEKASAGGIANYLKTKSVSGLVGGVEEMTTEVLQQLYANQTAQDIYNINQNLFEGVGESGGIGFGVGFLLNAMGANAKLLRNQGRDAEAQVIENQMAQFESKAESKPAPIYKVNGIKVELPALNDIIDNTSAEDLTKLNIDIENDIELRDRLQDKIVTSSIMEQVREANPDLNELSLKAITELEKQLQKLEGNKTQSGKDKAAAVRQQIKTIQENPLTEEVKVEEVVTDTTDKTKTEQDAIQEQGAATSVPSTEQPQLGLQEMGEGTAQPQGTPPGTQEVVTTEQEQEEVVAPKLNEFTIEQPIDDMGEIDYDAEEEVRNIAKKRNLGITSDREIAYVARDNDGNIIGGAFTSYDGDTYTFDVVVDESSEGTGVGSKLLDSVIKIPSDIKEVNPNVKLEVDVVSPTMKKMLEKRGFAVTRTTGQDRFIMEPVVSSKTQPAAEVAPVVEPEVIETPRFVRDLSVLLTPATVRAFSPITKRIKKLSINYDKLVKEYSKKKDAKILDKIKKTEQQILNDAKQEIIDAVAKVNGVSVKFSDNKRGLWDKFFEPSFNMTLSITPQADTKKVSDLLYDFSEKYSQDAFILEADSDFEEDVIDGKRKMPLTEFDSNGLMHYPQIIYTFDTPITDEQVADLSVKLEDNGLEAFSINNNQLQVSVIKFFTEDEQNNLTEDEQQEAREQDYATKTAATGKATNDVLGRNGVSEVAIRIRKSSYQGAVNEKSADQTRQYDRSDVLEAFQKSNTKVEKLAVELAALRQKEIELQKKGEQLSPEDKKRFDELNKVVQPVVEKTFEVNKKLYEDAKTEVEGIAQDAIKEVDASISPFPIKRPSRASVKTIRWYNTFTEKLGDGARVNIVVDTEANADKVFKIIDEKFPGDKEVRRISDTTELGYPKKLIEIRTSNGVIAEIQVITNEGYLAKDGLRGFTGDENQKSKAKQKLEDIRSRLGWNIPDGLGHYFYEIERDVNIDNDIRDEAKKLSNIYYKLFTDKNYSIGESFMNDVLAFKKKIDAADKTTWDKGNEGKAPDTLIQYESSLAAPVVEEEVVEQYEPITVKDTSYEPFTKYNATDYEEGEREADNGRTYTYLASITIPVMDADGNTIGYLKKLVSEDDELSFNAENLDGEDLDLDGYETLGQAKQALVDDYNKTKKKEFDKEAKKAAKQKVKEAEKAAKKAEVKAAKEAAKTAAKAVTATATEAPAVTDTLEGLLDVDVSTTDGMQTVLDVLNKADKAITDRLRGGANDALLAIPLSTVQLVIKTLKTLVRGGMILRDAIKKVAADNSVSQQIVKDILNISEIQDKFDALMLKVDAMVTRQRSRGTAHDRMVNNIDTYVRKSEVYQEANDAQKKILEREARARAGAAERRAPSIGRILGVLKDITNVSREDKLKIISQIRQLSKGAAQELANEIRELAKSGKITVNQAANIVSRFGKVNMLSEISVSKFVDYMTKVFNDADYANKLSIGNSLKKDLSKLSKNKEKNANLRDLAKEFVKINPSMVDDIDSYNEMASRIKEAIVGSKIKGENVSFAATVDIKDATEYINKTIATQLEKLRQEKIAQIQELMGIDASTFSYDDMMMLLEKGKPITKYNEGIIRDTINNMFDVFSSMIDKTISTGKDVFTGEDVVFTESQKDVVKRFMAMDLNNLQPKEALEAVDALANFLQNQSTAKMESVVSKYNGIVGAKQLKSKGIKAFPLKKYWSKLLGRVLGEQTTNLNVLFERMFKGFTAGGMVMDKMGLTKLINKKASAQTEANNIVDRFVELFYDKKANGEDFNSSYNNTERGMAAFMMRNVIGTEEEMKAEFKRRKELLFKVEDDGTVSGSIAVLEKGNDKEKAKAELYKKAYDKILADSNTIEEVKKKTDKVNLEGIKFWMDEWNNKYDQLSEVSENVYNKKLDKDINYTPDRFFTLSTDTGIIEISNSESAFLVNSGTNDLYQRETGVLMEAVRPESLPKGRYIDLSFDNNNANSMYDALVDINTAAPIRQIEAFLNSDDFESVFPNSDDAKIIKGSKGRPGRIDMYIRNIRNKNPYSNDELASTVKKLNKIASIGVGQALGGITQPFKQVIPVMLNTIVNAGGIDLSATFNKAKNDFISKSGYSIANRGIESQAQVESLNRLVDEVSKSKGEKLLNGIEKLNKKWLDTFLVKPDVFIARASWLSYYEKYLKDNDLYNTTVLERNTESSKAKITTEGIDYNTHKLNEDAANYAQRMVDRQQNVSDSDLAGKFFASRESANQLLVKTIMPFASFRMNQASRVGADLATLTNKTSSSEDKKIAAKSLAGYGIETATFRLVSIGISILLGSLAKAIMGIDEDDEEYNKRVDNIIKGAKTGTFTDIFSPLPIADKPIQELGASVMQSIEDATGLPTAIYSPRMEEYFQSAGLFGISLERLRQLKEIVSLSVTGKYTDDFGKEKTISSNSQDALKMLIVPALMTNVGLAPSEVNTIVRYGIKDAKKKTKSESEKMQSAETKKVREESKNQKIEALNNLRQTTQDQELRSAINDKIRELKANDEQKKEMKEENAREKEIKKKLLVDTKTGEEYDTESELKRYNKALWDKNFGPDSEWYKSHEDEDEVTKLLNKEIRKMEDEEYGYTPKTRRKKSSFGGGGFGSQSKRGTGFGAQKKKGSGFGPQ